jgi:hypothetical protein
MDLCTEIIENHCVKLPYNTDVLHAKLIAISPADGGMLCALSAPPPYFCFLWPAKLELSSAGSLINVYMGARTPTTECLREQQMV